MKTWEDADYWYTQSIRDKLWISLTFPDDTPESEVKEIMSIWSSLLSENWYILKNKWLITEETYNQLFYETGKHPLFWSTMPWWDPNMINASQSGFTGIEHGNSKISIWCEIQYSKESAMQWKKRENAIYKFKALFHGLLRWEFTDTPKSIYNAIRQRITTIAINNLEDPITGKNLWLTDHKDLMLYLIEEKWVLRAYWELYKDEVVVMLTTESHESEAKKRWKMKPLKQLDNANPWRWLYEDFKNKIRSL